MPHFGASPAEVVMRIVYDGEPEAGKTTNVHGLTAQVGLLRRGKIASPGSTARRTEFFDWLDFSGGFVDGKRVRCQLVSVPGQPELLHRRRYLLETADAVVYVADSRREHLRCTADNLARTRRVLDTLGREVPVGLVVQANKQDLPGALSAEELALALELPHDVAVLPATASVGDGVLRTFTLAGCLATERVRALLANTGSFDGGVVHDDPSSLYEALHALESLRPAAVDAASGLLLPAELEAVASDVFPPVKGRALLSRADVTSAWLAPDVPGRTSVGAIELRTAAGFTFYSGAGWCYSNSGAARRQLLELVSYQRTQAAPPGEGCALFVVPGPAADTFRVWALTAPFVTASPWLLATLQAP